MTRHIAAAAFCAALTAGSAAATPAPTCLPRSAEIVLGSAQKPDARDSVLYRGLSGRPQRGKVAVNLCPNTSYRIVPKDDRCLIRIPSVGSVTQIRAAIKRQMDARPTCPAPTIIVAKGRTTSDDEDRSRATAIIPGDTIDVRRRREIVVVVRPENSVKPACRVTAMPEAAGMSVGTAFKAYRARLAQSGCGGFDARVWTGDRLATPAEPRIANLILQRAWPDFDTPFNPEMVQPVWFAAPWPPPPPFILPDLRNRTLAEARRIAAEAGIAPPAAVVDNRLVVDQAAEDRKIAAQQPLPGSTLAVSERLLLVLQPSEAASPMTVPAALVVGGALGGVASAAAARRIMRRRETSDPARQARAVPVAADRDRDRIRVRPDIPLQRRTEGTAAQARLASLLPLSAIGAAPLLAALADTHPDLIEWSQSNRAGALPPRRLAQLILANLPAAFAVTIEDLALIATGTGTGGAISTDNRPCIEILNGDGSWRASIDLLAAIVLAPTILGRSGDQSPWALDISVSIAGRASNPSRVLIDDVRLIVALAA